MAVLLMGFGLTAVKMDLFAAAGTGTGEVKIEKQEDETKKDKKPKVFTNEDLEKIKEEKVPYVTDNTGGNNKSAVPTQKEAVENQVDPMQAEKYWKDKKKQIEAQVKTIEDRIKSLEERLNTLRKEWLEQRYGTQMIQIAGEIDKVVEEIETAKRSIEKIWEDFYEEARKDGALPGWLRDR